MDPKSLVFGLEPGALPDCLVGGRTDKMGPGRARAPFRWSVFGG